MAKYLLDTTVLIDYLRGHREVIELIEGLASQDNMLGTCCVNIAELYSGLTPEEQIKVDPLVNGLSYYDVTRQIARLAGSYRFIFARKGLTLTIADTLIAATAIEHSAILVTANVRDYPMKEVKLLKQP